MSNRSKVEARIAELVEQFNETQAAKPELDTSRGVQRGDIYLAHPDPDDPEVMNRYVLVVRVVASKNYVMALLIGNLPSFATDYDLILQPEDTQLGFESVVYANLRAPLWITQLGQRKGAVSEETLDLLPDVSLGAASAANAYRVGLPLQSKDDPRRAHKKTELRELHQVAATCTTALLAGDDFWGHERLDETGSQLLDLVLDSGARTIITMEHVFEPGDAPPLQEPQEIVGVLDPGIFTTPQGEQSNRQCTVAALDALLDNPGVIPPLFTPELLDEFHEAIQHNFPKDAQLLRKAFSGIHPNTRMKLLQRISERALNPPQDASTHTPEYVRVAA